MSGPRVPEQPWDYLPGGGMVVYPSGEAPAPRRVGPPEVEALHAIDQLIGNAETISAEELGRVRGIVLDALNGWHRRQDRAAAERADEREERDLDGGLWR